MIYLELVVPVLFAAAGCAAGLFLQGRMTRNVKVLLAFSGAYLLALTVLHLLPDLYSLAPHRAGMLIIAGFILQLVLDYFSKGVEHGHVHKSDQVAGRFPLGIFLSLCLHSVLEGMPLAGAAGADHGMHSHDTALLLGISIHKLPEAIALAALLYHSVGALRATAPYLLLYVLATPAGMLLGAAILKLQPQHHEYIYSVLLALAIGIFVHVSTTIIFEADEAHRMSWKKVLAIAAGLGLVMLFS